MLFYSPLGDVLHVHFSGWGFDKPKPIAVSNGRDHCCQTERKVGEAAANVQVAAYGKRLKAVAADYWQLINSPSTRKDKPAFL